MIWTRSPAVSEPERSAEPSLDRLRIGVGAVAASALLLGLAYADVFGATELRCQRQAAGTRCTIRETQLGLDRGSLVIADVQGAYVEDEGYDRARPRLVLQGAGGDVPLPSSVSWSAARQREAAAQVDGFAGDPRARELRLDESHLVGRGIAALGVLAALAWVLWPRLRRVDPPPLLRLDTAPLPDVAVSPPASELPATAPTPLSQRMLGVSLLRRAAYREVGADTGSWLAAFLIVALSALVIGYADGLGGSALAVNGTPIAASVANANLRALAAAGAACVGWPAAAVVSSWLAASRGGVRTAELMRALGFAHLFHLLSLLRYGGLLAWPLFFVAAYVATRAVCGAGRVRSLFATWCGQGFALLLAIPLWIAIISLGS